MRNGLVGDIAATVALTDPGAEPLPKKPFSDPKREQKR
jgi:hypothetical protein